MTYISFLLLSLICTQVSSIVCTVRTWQVLHIILTDFNYEESAFQRAKQVLISTPELLPSRPAVWHICRLHTVHCMPTQRISSTLPSSIYLSFLGSSPLSLILFSSELVYTPHDLSYHRHLLSWSSPKQSIPPLPHLTSVPQRDHPVYITSPIYITRTYHMHLISSTK